MFAGIGGFRAGLDRAGGFQCVGHCEIDKYAEASYRAIHDIREEERYYPDARTIDPSDLPDFDLLCGGFPCQAFSLAGRRRGFADTRGTLFFEMARLAEAKRPRYLLAENVPGLLSHDQGKTFAVILSTLDGLGYHVEWAVLNSKHFGVPQSRKRVFLICCLDPRCAGKILPVPGHDGKALIQVLGGSQGYRVYDPEGVACTQTAGGGGQGVKTGLYLVGFSRKAGITGERITALSLNASDSRGINRNQTQNTVFVDLCAGHPVQSNDARCIIARYGQTTLSNHKAERSGVLIFNEENRQGWVEESGKDAAAPADPACGTQVGRTSQRICDAACVQEIIGRGGRIRRLMPRECLRLQGFDEKQIDKILAITSDAKAYKQAGNSVTVNVIEAIGRRLRAVDEALRQGDAA